MSWYYSAPVNWFVKLSGYTYSNLARLFMRLFVGVMFLQFGIRHLVNYSELCNSFPTVLHMSSECSLIIMIIIELVCSLLIMAGFLTRLSVIPPICTMIAAEYYILHDMLPESPCLWTRQHRSGLSSNHVYRHLYLSPHRRSGQDIARLLHFALHHQPERQI